MADNSSEKSSQQTHSAKDKVFIDLTDTGPYDDSRPDVKEAARIQKQWNINLDGARLERPKARRGPKSTPQRKPLRDVTPARGQACQKRSSSDNQLFTHTKKLNSRPPTVPEQGTNVLGPVYVSRDSRRQIRGTHMDGFEAIGDTEPSSVESQTASNQQPIDILTETDLGAPRAKNGTSRDPTLEGQGSFHDNPSSVNASTSERFDQRVHSPFLSELCLEVEPQPLMSDVEPYDHSEEASSEELGVFLTPAVGEKLITETTHPLHPKPEFERFHPEDLSVLTITHKVLDLMRSALSEKQGTDHGLVYMLRMIGRPGFVKIGCTRKSLDKRMKEINECIPHKLQSISDDDRCPVPNYMRVERLIHAELHTYRRAFSCDCGKRNFDDEADNGATRHNEWFEIDEEKALEVVSRWKKWIRTRPYYKRTLRATEEMRIKIYCHKPEKMKDMQIAGSNEWRWDVFMCHTEWELRWLGIRDLIAGEPLRRSTRRGHGSYWDLWQARVQLHLMLSLVAYILSVIEPAFLPPAAYTLISIFWRFVVLGRMVDMCAF